MIEFFPDFSTAISIFGVGIQWYAIMILTGAFIAYYISELNFRKSPYYQKELLSDLFYKALFIGIIGARVWYILFSDLGAYLSNPIEIIMIRNGGLAVQGGVLAGLVYGYYYFKKHDLPFLEMADMIVPNILIAQALGRWGNFFNQEAFGAITTRATLEAQMIPSFIIDKMYIAGEYRQPTFLYESVLNIVAFLVIVLIIKRFKNRKHGDLAASYFILYGIVRVYVESMRTDSLMLGPIRMAQLTAIVLLLMGVGLMVVTRLPKKSKKPLIMFDLDGTLIDTNPLIFASYRHVFSIHKPDYELSDEELLTFIGPSLKDSFGKHFEEEQIEDMIKAYREHNLSHHEVYASVYPTVLETLSKLKDKKYMIAVVTTKYHDAAKLGLDIFGLTPYVDFIIGSDEITHPKPHPESVLLTMDKFQAKEGYMIGDNVSDIQAGKRAGVKTIGVSWSIKGREVLEAEEPDYMIDQMIDLLKILEEN